MIWRCDLVPQYGTYKKEIDEAIQRVLYSGRYILGGEVAEFERGFAQYVGVEHSVGVANATDGLTLSLTAIGIGSGDQVLTTPFTAIPTVSAIVDSGAIPTFVDICPDTFLLDLDRVDQAITSKTKAIIPVHIFGNMVDIPRLRELVGHHIAIIEDASQAHGSKLNSVQAGSMGDIGVFSFYPTKNLGCYGDGGAVVTGNHEIAEKVRLLRMYGMIDKDHIIMNGVNSRLDELQASVLNVKLKYLDEMNKKRNAIAKRYREKLRASLFEHQAVRDNVYSNYHVFVSRFKGNRQKFVEYLIKEEIQTNIYYPIPLHLQKANEHLGNKKGDLPISERLCDEVIALPMYPEMPQDIQDYIIDRINKF